MKKFFTFLIAFLSISFISEAKYVQTCAAKYKTEDGWSKTYKVNFTFMAGYEMNTTTKTYNYDMYSVYAIIFWGEGKATIIKSSSYLSCGTEVAKSCISSSISDIKGKDQDGDEWNVCVSTYCY